MSRHPNIQTTSYIATEMTSETSAARAETINGDLLGPGDSAWVGRSCSRIDQAWQQKWPGTGRSYLSTWKDTEMLPGEAHLKRRVSWCLQLALASSLQMEAKLSFTHKPFLVNSKPVTAVS